MNAVVEHDIDARDEVFVDLLASSVHDIKNSIGLLLSAADALNDALPADLRATRSLGDLQYEARRINYDLIHLLGLFKLERTHQPIRLTVVDCRDLLDELYAFNAELLARQGITLAIESRLASEGYFDRELVLGVMNSIVNNAFRHAQSQVLVVCEVRDGYTVLTVEDDGPGYAPKLLAVVDDQPGATTYRHGNTGLGLYFARRIARLHEHRGRHGRVVLRNTPRGGGCFELWLP